MFKKLILLSLSVSVALTLICFVSCGDEYDPVLPDGEEPDTTIVTDIDGNTYDIIHIGEQVWMAENLKVTRYRNGNLIPYVTTNVVWESLSTGGYCYYSNIETNRTIYGNLYNWAAVTDSRNLAPTGWHVPTDAEFQTLIDYLGGDSIAGGKMKTTGTAYWLAPNDGATNESGFSAMPGGLRDYTGHCTNIIYHAYFWTTTSRNTADAWYRRLNYNNAEAERDSYDKGAGFSVRCVRD